jgi:hypothetical protein
MWCIQRLQYTKMAYNAIPTSRHRANITGLVRVNKPNDPEWLHIVLWMWTRLLILLKGLTHLLMKKFLHSTCKMNTMYWLIIRNKISINLYGALDISIYIFDNICWKMNAGIFNLQMKKCIRDSMLNAVQIPNMAEINKKHYKCVFWSLVKCYW